jgi:6,7-dimethyl-8-ribityllumazine synthase
MVVTHTPHVPSGEPLPGARILVVEARYYEGIADALLAGVRAALEAAETEMDLITVSGALEIPAMIAIALDAAEGWGRPYDAAIALGCVIRGETGHYDIVAGESARALMDLSVARRLPIGNGILTVETEAQASARANVDDMNKGGGAAEAALGVLRAARRLKAGSRTTQAGHRYGQS